MPIRFSLAQVETTKQNLDALPAADKDTRQVGLKDAIRALAPTLRKLHARGYSRDKIVELLREQGITVGKSTLNQYVGQKAAKRPTSRPAASDGQAAAPTTAAASGATPTGPEAAEVGMRKTAAIPAPARQPLTPRAPAPTRG